MRDEFETINLSIMNSCAEIPNAPYLYGASRRFITKTLEIYGFQKGTESRQEGNFYSHDQYATYVKIKRGNSPYKLLITTHLDHPFLVLDGKGNGQPVGSIEMNKLIKEEGEIPIKIYANNGKFLGEERVQRYKEQKGKGKVTVTKNTDYPMNSHGIWNLEPLEVENGILKMRNADNSINTAIILSMIGRIISSTPSDIDLEFIFCNLEEVIQISATAIGSRSRTPYGQIDKNTLILVLESANIETRLADYPILDLVGLKPASYDGGLVLRLNDRDLVYGQRLNQENLLEHALLHSLDVTQTIYQRTLLSGVCDATAFTLFTNSPNIASLTIPTRYKHNVDESGRLVHEQLLLQDVRSSYQALHNLILYIARGDIKRRNDVVNEQLKATSLAASLKELESLRSARLGALAWGETRLKHGVFYPENTLQQFSFFIDNLRSRIY